MRRRDFVTRFAIVLALGVGLLVLPTALNAQKAAGIKRVGWLEVCSPGPKRPHFDIFRAHLAELGYAEGKNLIIEQRFADCHYDRMSELAADLVQLPVDVIFTMGTRAARIATQTVKTTPLVVYSCDPFSAREKPGSARRKSDRCYVHDDGDDAEASRTHPRGPSQDLTGDVSS
jgi:ABC-type uncharacterized transport system substrate-binding protein